jgi:alpha-mannosidase
MRAYGPRAMTRVTNPLPQLTIDRLRKSLADLRAQAPWNIRCEDLAVEAAPVASLLAEHPSPAQAQRLAYKPLPTGSVFGPPRGDWHQRWCRVRIPAPRAGERGRRFLEWRCQGEATAFLDGEPWTGLDGAHPVMPLPDRACTLHLDVGLYPASAIWTPNIRQIDEFGARFDACRLIVRDQRLWEAQFDLEVLEQSITVRLAAAGLASPGVGYHVPLDRLDPLTRLLIAAAGELCDAASSGIAALAEAASDVLARFPAETWQPGAALIGHAHIDLVWLWPELVTRRKGQHTFASMLRLMERWPEFVFSTSQPALYRMLEEASPAQVRAVRRRIAEGRWEATGAFEVEPDNNLPCGEALVRSLLLGQERFRKLRGAPSSVCWIPDVFGYSAALPQILRLGGVERFYTTKMSWSAVTRFPYTSFVWRGHDGSEVLTHLTTSPAGYNGNASVGELTETLSGHRQVEVHPEMLTPVGYGDGGGGVTEEMLGRARRLASLSGVPKAAWTTAEAFFDRLEKTRSALPVYQGELYLEYHRGTYTTQSDFKAAYRQLERALQEHEAVRVARRGAPLPDEAWLRLAFAQFHDALPGSSIGLVYAQLGSELRQLAGKASAAARAELAATGGSPGFLAFNPLPMARRTVVELPGAIAALQTPDGLALPVQTVGTGRQRRTLAIVDLPALGAERLLPQSRATASGLVPAMVEAGARVLDNGCVRAVFDHAGRLASLAIDGQDLLLTAPAGLALYHDVPANFDAWDIDHDALRRPVSGHPTMRLALAESGAVRAVLRGSARLGTASQVEISWIVEAGSPWLQVELAIDWREDHKLLKFHCPTSFQGRSARFGAPFGSVARPQQPGDARDEAMWEVPGSRWAAVTDDDGTGLAMVTEAKYGFSCRDGDLGLSLLRAPTDPDPKADRGTHRLRFAIGAHRDSGIAERPCTAACADLLFTPAVVVAGGALAPPPFAFDHLGSLVPAWTRPLPEGGFEVRLHEVAGRRGQARLNLAGAGQQVACTDFLGRRLPGGQPRRRDGRQYDLPYKPYQIITVQVR